MSRPIDREKRKIDPHRIDDVRHLVRIAKRRLGTWQAVAEWYGGRYSRASFYRLVHDERFLPPVGLIDVVDGKPLPPATAVVRRCPTCDRVHVLGDCGGKRGQLVIIAEHEVVIDINRCRPIPVSTNGRGRRRRRPAIRLGVGDAEFYEQLNDERKQLGLTWGEYLRHLCGKKR